MKRFTLIAITTIFAILLFGISSFAANNIASDAVQGVRNVVGGAENAVEDAASGVVNGVRSGINGVENTTNNAGNKMQGAMTTTNNNDGYNATRTATTGMATNNANKFLGMGATAWGWLIMAIVGIITIALVWYYGKEHESNYNHNDDNY